MMTCDQLRLLLKTGQNVEAKKFCQVVFPCVSRTFAVNVGRLPRNLSFQVLISYLLCRIVDTIEDDPDFTPNLKAELLAEFASLLTKPEWRERLQPVQQAFASRDHANNEVLLLQHCHYVLECFNGFAEPVRIHIAHWVTELALGMKQYALRKPEDSKAVTFLNSIADLEEYCYYVAGTVGHLLTGLFRQCYPCIDEARYRQLEAKASSFGIGLQLTNIIKDSVGDYQRGWCYLPTDLLAQANLTGAAFLEASRRQDAQNFMYHIMERAKQHLDDALDYSCLLPYQADKARTFCFLPLFMAIKTLTKAAHSEQLFDVARPVKITRADVKHILAYTYLCRWSNHLMRNWYHRVSSRFSQKRSIL